MILSIQPLKGMAPSVAANQLPDQMSQEAFNCFFDLGSLRPVYDLGTGVAPSKTGTVLTIYPYNSQWFNWIYDVNCVKSPLTLDLWARRYWTGDGVPKMTVLGIATSGSDYPSNSYNLGIPAPATACAAVLSGTPTSSNPLDAENRAYVFTYVSAYGEEGPPSNPSNIVVWYPGNTVDLASIDTAPSGSYNIATKRIYRTNTGSSDTSYQLVGEIAVGTTTLSDTVDSDALGEVMPSESWLPPNDSLVGLIPTPAGTLCGFYGTVFCESEPYLPHAWPAAYQIPLDETIIAIGSYGTTVLAVTTGAPYVMTGTPGARIAERLETGYACISKRGFVDMGYACIYPAIDGLMLAGMQQIKLVSENILTQQDWAALNPSSIHAYLYDSKYIAFWDNAVSEGFIYDPRTGDFALHDVAATAGYHNPADGKLYLVSNGQIKQWQGAVTTMTATWKSKKFVLPNQFTPSFSAAQVQALAYPLTFKLYADGVLRHTQTVTSAAPFRLPSGYRCASVEVEIETTSVVTSIAVAHTMAELGQV